jgi:uncharacterized protein YceH (UPF0502 family)
LREVDGVLEQLIGRELVTRLPRRPGQKETRYRHLLSEGATPAEAEASADSSAESVGGGERVSELEERVAMLEQQVAALQQALGAADAATPETGGAGIRPQSDPGVRLSALEDREPGSG